MFDNLQQAQKFCKENAIQMVDFMMIDLDGRWRHLTIPVDRFTEDLLENGVGFDGSNYGFAPVEKSDMVFIPDLKSAYVDEFAEIPTLAMIGDVFGDRSAEKPAFRSGPQKCGGTRGSLYEKAGYRGRDAHRSGI